jgi:hypothetical protein
MALGGVALAIAMFCAWWLRPVPIAVPSPAALLKTNVAAMPPHRLTYHLDALWEPGVLDIVNQDPFEWNDVHVDIGDGDESFQCPALPTIKSGHTLSVQSRLCRSSDGRMPTHVCVVRLAAKEGGITSGLEPCAPVQ